MARPKLFQLFDLKAGLVAGPIMIERNAGPAIRAFHSLLGNQETTPGQYPEDYNLLVIGEQDDETGELTPFTPEIVATGQAWKQQHTLGTAGTARSGAATLSGSDITRADVHAALTRAAIDNPRHGDQ